MSKGTALKGTALKGTDLNGTMITTKKQHAYMCLTVGLTQLKKNLQICEYICEQILRNELADRGLLPLAFFSYTKVGVFKGLKKQQKPKSITTHGFKCSFMVALGFEALHTGEGTGFAAHQKPCVVILLGGFLLLFITLLEKGHLETPTLVYEKTLGWVKL